MIRRRRRAPDPARYQRDDHGSYGWQEHLDGAEWFTCNPPPRRHQCWPQTRFWDGVDGELTERCGCGGLRLDGHGPWIERNTHTAPTDADRAKYARDKLWEALVTEYGAASEAGDRPRAKRIRAQLALLREETGAP